MTYCLIGCSLFRAAPRRRSLGLLLSALLTPKPIVPCDSLDSTHAFASPYCDAFAGFVFALRLATIGSVFDASTAQRPNDDRVFSSVHRIVYCRRSERHLSPESRTNGQLRGRVDDRSVDHNFHRVIVSRCLYEQVDSFARSSIVAWYFVGGLS